MTENDNSFVRDHDSVNVDALTFTTTPLPEAYQEATGDLLTRLSCIDHELRDRNIEHHRWPLFVRKPLNVCIVCLLHCSFVEEHPIVIQLD